MLVYRSNKSVLNVSLSLSLELRSSLEEHQSALELIMSKYREQVFRLLMASKREDPTIVTQLREQHTNVSPLPTCAHTIKIVNSLCYLHAKYNSVLLFNVFVQEMQAHIEKINEMATVMRKAIEVDEGRLCEDEERIKRLEVRPTLVLNSKTDLWYF